MSSKEKPISNHQFGFKMKRWHGTTEQIHRVVNTIDRDIERKQMTSNPFKHIQNPSTPTSTTTAPLTITYIPHSAL